MFLKSTIHPTPPRKTAPNAEDDTKRGRKSNTTLPHPRTGNRTLAVKEYPKINRTIRLMCHSFWLHFSVMTLFNASF